MASNWSIGDGKARRHLRAKYLVGADGSRSTVREAAGITRNANRARPAHGAARLSTRPSFTNLLQRYPGKAIYKVLHPDLDGYWMFFGRVDHGRSWFFHAPVPPGTTIENYDFKALLHRAVGRTFDLELEYAGLWELRIALGRPIPRRVACSLRATRPIPILPMAATASIPDSRMPETWAGSWRQRSAAGAVRRSSTATRPRGGRSLPRRRATSSRGTSKRTGRCWPLSRPEKDLEAFRRHGGNGRKTPGTWTPSNRTTRVRRSSDEVAGASPSAVGSHRQRARPGHHLCAAGAFRRAIGI